MQRGFVVIDLNLTQQDTCALAKLAHHMATCAACPDVKDNRGPGRTRVNNANHIEDSTWANVLNIIMNNKEVEMVLSEMPGGIGLCDCGGDVVEAQGYRRNA